MIAFEGSAPVCAIVGAVIAIISIILTVLTGKKMKEMVTRKPFPASVWSSLSIIIITIVCLIDPHDDLVYYGASIIAIIGVILNVVDLIGCFNLLAMRPLPQFENYKGGDDRA